MSDALLQQLRQVFQGRVCLVGVGNVDRGDDGVGVCLAQKVEQACHGAARAQGGSRQCAGDAGGSRAPLGFAPYLPANHKRKCSQATRSAGLATPLPAAEVLVAHTTPERLLPHLADARFDNVLFLDAVDMGRPPGSVVLLNAAEMVARFPQISTHKISLGLLARMIEANGPAKVWLLGLQPASVRGDAGLSPPLEAALAVTADVIADCLEGAVWLNAL